MYSLRINNEEAELDAGQTVQLNKLFLDPSDLSARGINYTNKFTLPFTAKNDRLTGFPSRTASNNRAFETRGRFTLSDRNTIIATGDVVVDSFDDKKGIKIQLVEGGGFWSKAGSKPLNDLIAHSDDFEFTALNMDGLKTKGSSIFLTALHSATGDDTGTALTNYNQTRPCYYFKNILDKVVNDLGYDIDYTNTLEQTDLLSLGCLSNAGSFFVSDYKKRFENTTQFEGINYNSGTSVFTKSGNTSQNATQLENALYKTSYVVKGWVMSAVDTSIELIIGSQTSTVLVPKGRSFVNYRTDSLEIGSIFIVNFPTQITLEDFYVYSAINESDIFEINPAINIYDFFVLADYNLPQQTYKQFIKSLIKLNFLDFDIDENKKVVTVRYIPDIINSNNVVDFSDKVDRYVEVKRGDMYGQLSVFKYENDTNIDPSLGNAYININNENAEESKEILSVPEFSSSEEIEVSGENILLCSIYNTAEGKRESIKERIVYFVETGAFGFNATFNEASWQRVYSKHYVSFVEATKRERAVIFDALISNLDFRSLQRNPIIYVDFMESVFLVMEVSGFEKGKKCKLKCIKYV